MGGSGNFSPAQSYGSDGTGVLIDMNGKTKTYVVRAGKLREFQSANVVNTGNKSMKDVVTSMIDNGGKFLNKKQIDAMTNARNIERENTPDYEMGNPFNERGKKRKTIYRPKRVNGY